MLTFLLISFLCFITRDDIKRRAPSYLSDWTDAFKDMKKVIPAVLFLYFACLSPAVSFGTIASQITNGSIGIVEFLVSCGCSGMVSVYNQKWNGLSLIWKGLSHEPAYLYDLAIRDVVWSTNVVYCSHGVNPRVYLRALPILHCEQSSFLPYLFMGRIVDGLFLCVIGACRVQSAHPLLYKIHG